MEISPPRGPRCRTELPVGAVSASDSPAIFSLLTYVLPFGHLEFLEKSFAWLVLMKELSFFLGDISGAALIPHSEVSNGFKATKWWNAAQVVPKSKMKMRPLLLRDITEHRVTGDSLSPAYEHATAMKQGLTKQTLSHQKHY